MITLYGMLESGHVQKVQMVLRRRGLPYRVVLVSQMAGQTRLPAFLAVNPMGKVPAVRLDDGTVLTDSGAILYYFAEGTGWWPEDRLAQAETLRWMFFEQYQHEPPISTMRYLLNYTPDPAAHAARVEELRSRSLFALDVMEERLTKADWFVGGGPTLADLALYPYTRTAPEGGLSLDPYPAIRAWFERVEALPGYLAPGDNKAAATETFAEHFGR